MCLWLDVLIVALIVLVIFVTAMCVKIAWALFRKRNGDRAQG